MDKSWSPAVVDVKFLTGHNILLYRYIIIYIYDRIGASMRFAQSGS